MYMHMNHNDKYNLSTRHLYQGPRASIWIISRFSSSDNLFRDKCEIMSFQISFYIIGHISK
jgi:hypothetical protein